MAFEKPTPAADDESVGDNQSSGADRSSTDPPDSLTVTINGEEMPVSDALESLSGRLDAVANNVEDTAPPVAVEVPWSDQTEPIPLAVEHNAHRLDDLNSLMATVESQREGIVELQETVKGVGAVLAELSDDIDSNPVSWNHPARRGEN